MKNLNVIARILFALPLLIFGLMHFAFAKNMAGMVPSYIPGGIFWIYFTGLGLILTSVSLLINKYTKISGLLLSLMLLIFILTMHIPGIIAGNQMAMGGLLKDVGLIAGALMIVANSK
jgi:putative oxidoreductase